MKKFLVACLLIWGHSVLAQTPGPLETVQRQLDTYNRQDLKGFAACFSEDVQWYRRLGDSLPALVGRKAVEKFYAEMFRNYPNNKSTLLGRMVQGQLVIDHEWITGREKDMRIVAIYEVQEGLIVRCWFIR
jgi:hypothetical protein